MGVYGDIVKRAATEVDDLLKNVSLTDEGKSALGKTTDQEWIYRGLGGLGGGVLGWLIGRAISKKNAMPRWALALIGAGAGGYGVDAALRNIESGGLSLRDRIRLTSNVAGMKEAIRDTKDKLSAITSKDSIGLLPWYAPTAAGIGIGGAKGWQKDTVAPGSFADTHINAKHKVGQQATLDQSTWHNALNNAKYKQKGGKTLSVAKLNSSDLHSMLTNPASDPTAYAALRLQLISEVQQRQGLTTPAATAMVDNELKLLQNNGKNLIIDNDWNGAGRSLHIDNPEDYVHSDNFRHYAAKGYNAFKDATLWTLALNAANVLGKQGIRWWKGDRSDEGALSNTY